MRKPVALADEPLPQLLVIIDFAIKNHPHGAVFVRERLVAGREIDDAEAPHADAAASLDADALIVRTAVPDGLAHRFDDLCLGVPLAQEKARNSAHIRDFSTGWFRGLVAFP